MIAEDGDAAAAATGDLIRGVVDRTGHVGLFQHPERVLDRNDQEFRRGGGEITCDREEACRVGRLALVRGEGMAQRGLRFVSRRWIGRKPRSHLGHDVHAHVSGRGVDDVAVRIEAGRWRPLASCGVLDLGDDEFKGTDEFRAVGRAL